MIAKVKVHDQLARLLSYPETGAEQALQDCIDELTKTVDGAGEELEALRKLLEGGGKGEAEELYCRTFDNNSKLALEVGWHVYGETYDRGAFMVRMRTMMRDLGLKESSELPDHLSHALPVVGRLDKLKAEELTRSALLPAARKMLEGFESPEHPYRGVISLTCTVLRGHGEVEETFDV